MDEKPKKPAEVKTSSRPFTMRTRSKTDPIGAARKRFRISLPERPSKFIQEVVDAAAELGDRRSSLGGYIDMQRLGGGDGGGPLKRPAAAEPSRATPSPSHNASAPPVSKRRRTMRPCPDGERESDHFCWACHRDGRVVCCDLCPRVFHIRCVNLTSEPPGEWVCPECSAMMRAECVDTRSKAMSMLTMDQLCALFRAATQRMKYQGCEPFLKAVDTATLPHYNDYIVYPVDLLKLEKDVNRRMFGSTEAFLAEAKWILHNCIVFNGAQHKLTPVARMIIRICKHEMNEIEICPDCYTNSCSKRNDSWFCLPCRTPHTLVWAKMKGYPFWPAKTLREVDGQVDVRFFGEHDRAWVPVSQVYLLSEEPPTAMKNQRGGFRQSVDEVKLHITKLREKFGSFVYLPYRTPYNVRDPYPAVKPAKTPSRGGRRVPPATTDAKSSARLGAARRVGASIASKTASAVKSKYSSIITTRRAKAAQQAAAPSARAASRRQQGAAPRTRAESGGRRGAAPSRGRQGAAPSRGRQGAAPSASAASAAVPAAPRVAAGGARRVLEKIEGAMKQRQELEEEEEEEGEQREEETVNETSNETPNETPTETATGTPNETPAETSTESTHETTANAAAAPSGVDRSNRAADGAEEGTGNEGSETQKGDGAGAAGGREAAGGMTSKSSLDSLVNTCKAKLAMRPTVVLNKIDDEPSSSSSDSDNDDDDDDDDDDTSTTETSPAKTPPVVDSAVVEKPVVDSAVKLSPAATSTDKDASDTTVDASPSETSAVVDVSSGETSTAEPPPAKTPPPTTSSSAEDSSTAEKSTASASSLSAPSRDSAASPCECKLAEVKSDPSQTDSKPSLSEPSLSEPSLSESSLFKPSLSKPSLSDSSLSKPSLSDSSLSKPSLSESSLAKPSLSESSLSKPSLSEPSPSKPSLLETSLSESSLSKPSLLEPSPSTPSLSESSLSKPSLVKPSLSESSLSKPSLLESSLAKPSLSESSLSKPSLSEPSPSEPSRSEPSLSEPSLLSESSPMAMSASKPVSLRLAGESESDDDDDGGDGDGDGGSESDSSHLLIDLDGGAEVVKPTEKVKAQSREVTRAARTSRPASQFVPKLAAKSELKSGGPAAGTSSGVADAIDENIVRQLTLGAAAINVDKYAETLVKSVRHTLQDMYQDLIQTDAGMTIKKYFQQEIDRLQWRHQQQLAELNHNHELVVVEARAFAQSERGKVLSDLRKKMAAEKTKAVEETKKKQWCAHCEKEAMFYCCWNTSYCDYPCQQAHWPHHMEACTQAPATTAVVAKPTAVTVKPVVATAARNVYVQLPPPQQQQQQRGAAGRVAVSTSAAVLQSKRDVRHTIEQRPVLQYSYAPSPTMAHIIPAYGQTSPAPFRSPPQYLGPMTGGVVTPTSPIVVNQVYLRPPTPRPGVSPLVIAPPGARPLGVLRMPPSHGFL